MNSKFHRIRNFYTREKKNKIKIKGKFNPNVLPSPSSINSFEYQVKTRPVERSKEPTNHHPEFLLINPSLLSIKISSWKNTFSRRIKRR